MMDLTLLVPFQNLAQEWEVKTSKRKREDNEFYLSFRCSYQSYLSTTEKRLAVLKADRDLEIKRVAGENALAVKTLLEKHAEEMIALEALHTKKLENIEKIAGIQRQNLREMLKEEEVTSKLAVDEKKEGGGKENGRE